MSYNFSEIAKLDSAAVNGLSGTANSLAYKVHEIEKHLHNSEQVYGQTATAIMPLLRKSPLEFTVTGGNNAYGTELLLHQGDVIESGSSTKKFDLNTMYITAVDAANKPTIVEFYSGVLGSEVTGVTAQNTGETLTKTGHGLADDDRVIITNAGDASELNLYTVYWVTGAPVGDTFQLALTDGGSAITFGGDRTGIAFKKVTQTLLTETIISMAATTSDAVPWYLLSPRVACNSALSVRAKSVTGSTVAIKFFLGLHTYTA